MKSSHAALGHISTVVSAGCALFAAVKASSITMSAPLVYTLAAAAELARCPTWRQQVE